MKERNKVFKTIFFYLLSCISELGETLCRSYGGHLARLETREEIEMISHYLTDIAPDCQGIGDRCKKIRMWSYCEAYHFFWLKFNSIPQTSVIWLGGVATNSNGYWWDQQDASSFVQFTNWIIDDIVPSDPTGTGIALACEDFSGCKHTRSFFFSSFEKQSMKK